MNLPILQTRPALFLDRDGVINIEKNYVHCIKDFEFVEGIFDLCQIAALRKMPIVIVTNQAGIGRGFYSEEQFYELTVWMCERFDDAGVPIAAVYFCPFHPEHGLGMYRKESYDRKPNPGMILRARDELGLDLSLSVLVGDKSSDIMAAKAAGVGFTVLLGEDLENTVPTVTIRSLTDACTILKRYSIWP